MKYQTPKYEMSIMETTDIVAASNKFHVVRDDEGNGKITLNAIDLFR
ncbi:MAG: hypothetical protein J6D23_01395 [Clostridia bacterium]|nr:hypothetical protein [Clostridia bacterium]